MTRASKVQVVGYVQADSLGEYADTDFKLRCLARERTSEPMWCDNGSVDTSYPD